MVVRHDHRGPKAGAGLNLYVDSSAWAKVFVEEPGAHQVEELWAEAEGVVCLSIGYLEVRSAIARRLKAQPAAHARAFLDNRWLEVETVALDDRLIGLAGPIIDLHHLKTLDALHLATFFLARSRIEGLELLTADRRLDAAARSA